MAINDDDRKYVRKWIDHQLRSGTRPEELHELVDQSVRWLLTDTLSAERKERQRADRAEVERDEAIAELQRLQEGLGALRVAS